MRMSLPTIIRSSFLFNLFISLAALTAFSVVNPAAAQTTVSFDFETAPDSDTGDGVDPEFIDPVSGFTLSHTPGPVDGNAQWTNDGRCTPRAGVGCMRLSDDGLGPVVVTATINFSAPVSSITMWAGSFTVAATITPILSPTSTSPPPVAIPVSASGGTYSKIDIVGGGPYIGLELSAPLPNQLQWDDFEVTPVLVENDWQGAGDGLLTLDTITGLEWLDLTETTNETVADVSAEFGPGGDFEGFRYATATEVGQFYTDAGLSGFATDPNTVFGNSNATQIAFGEALQALWGTTLPQPLLSQVTSSGFIDELVAGSTYRLTSLTVRTGPAVVDRWAAGTRASTANTASTDWGSALVRSSGETSPTTARDIPTPTGDDITVINIEVFEQVAAKVVVAGTTNADFCIAPDPRELFIPNGVGSRGKGKGNGAGGGANVFIPRSLSVSELSGTGTCTGDLEFEDEDFDTWEELLAVIDLQVAQRYRGYVGELTLPDDTTATEAVWLVVGVVRSSAEFDGPVAVIGSPEELIDYSNTPTAESPGCDRDLKWRNLDLGGAVDAFGEFLNVEGNTMIVETAQCNSSRSLTRRTTHLFPVRLSGPGAASGKENENIRTQLDGIEATLGEAAVCADASLIADMQLSLNAARLAFAQKRYKDAIEGLEEVARSAKNAETFGTGFMSCPIDSNYRGNFMSRGLSAAFTVHDRFLHADAYVKYFIPADLEVPLLDPTP